MLQTLIRLEDVGPGGYYESAESQMKLVAVADYLYMLGVPFQVAVISRFVNPERGVDCSIGNPYDLAAMRFVQTLHALCARGASLGMHGYTHQYGQSISGEGYEFAYSGCNKDCPPGDPQESLVEINHFQHSYAYSRFCQALSAFHAAGLRPDWFETPHYTASEVQRKILEACTWLMYEDNPETPDTRQVTFRSSKSLLGKTYYVPTPLGYVAGASVDEDVNRIMSEAKRFGEGDLASFFYHPFLEFPYIHIRKHTSLYYEERSPLKRLIRHMLSIGRRFVSIRDLQKMIQNSGS
jgi:peptidoglycan/xylan/chitin deacetylase (PgdA/CDA1 family)